MSMQNSNSESGCDDLVKGSTPKSFLPESTEFLIHQARTSGQAVFTATRALADKASQEIDLKGVAGGVAAMSAGEALGAAVGGVIGSVAGPAGTFVGAQLGGLAGTSLGARYGYEYAADAPQAELAENPKGPSEDQPSTPGTSASSVLAVRYAEQIGETLGEAGGKAIGTAVGGARTGSVLGSIGLGLGGSLGERSVSETLQGDQQKQSYRKAPTRSWFMRIGKEKLSETVLSGVLGTIAGMVAGPIAEKIGRNAGVVASSRLKWGGDREHEFVDPPRPCAPAVSSNSVESKLETDDSDPV